MNGSSREVSDLPTRETKDLNGQGSVGGGGVAQLAVAIGTPAPNRPVGLQRQSMPQARYHPDDVRQARNPSGRARIIQCSVSQLTIGVPPPSPNRSIRPQDSRVIAATGDLD